MGKTKAPIFPPLILNVYKPKGIGSSDVVRHFKYNLPFGFGKIGHLGTLDPFAEGVLLIAIAGASRLSDLIHNRFTKNYESEGVLGFSYDTGDMTGKILNNDTKIETKLVDYSIERLNKVAKTFVGEYFQIPPFFSATKHNGLPLYKLARQGNFIKKEPVRRVVSRFEILSIEGRNIHFRCEVSSGTYIRVLFEDFAKKLDTFGVLKSLKRTKIGPFSIANCLEKVNWPVRGDDFGSILLKPQLSDMSGACLCPGRVFGGKVFRLSEMQWLDFKNGKDLASSSVSTCKGELVGLYSPSGRVCALAYTEGAQYKPIVRFSPFID